MDRLRNEAGDLKRLIKEQREKARSKAGNLRSGRPSGRSDYEDLLQRKLQRVTAEIESHLALHRCQD